MTNRRFSVRKQRLSDCSVLPLGSNFIRCQRGWSGEERTDLTDLFAVGAACVVRLPIGL
jgi:hypothetical protein